MIGFCADGTADTGLSPSKQLRQERERCRVHYVSSEHPQGHVRNYQTVRSGGGQISGIFAGGLYRTVDTCKYYYVIHK